MKEYLVFCKIIENYSKMGHKSSIYTFSTNISKNEI